MATQNAAARTAAPVRSARLTAILSRQPAPGIVAGRVTPSWIWQVARCAIQASEGALWRQTSTTSAEGELVSDDAVPGARRVVTIDGLRVAVLICGELFSWRARRDVGGTGPGLVVDIGHSGMGQGLIPAMRNVANGGECPVAHSQHLKRYGGSLHFVDAQAEQQSIPVDEDYVIEQGDMWAAWAVRTV